MRFYNSGKFLHQRGRHKDTGEMIESVLPMKPEGHEEGTCILNIHGVFKHIVKAGEWVDVPESVFQRDPGLPEIHASERDKHIAEMVQRLAPCLLTEAQAKDAGLVSDEPAPKPAAKPAKAKE